MRPDRKVLTTDELAAYLRVSRSTVYRLLKCQKIPGFKVGKDWRFDSEQIDGWVQSWPGMNRDSE